MKEWNKNHIALSTWVIRNGGIYQQLDVRRSLNRQDINLRKEKTIEKIY